MCTIEIIERIAAITQVNQSVVIAGLIKQRPMDGR